MGGTFLRKERKNPKKKKKKKIPKHVVKGTYLRWPIRNASAHLKIQNTIAHNVKAVTSVIAFYSLTYRNEKKNKIQKLTNRIRCNAQHRAFEAVFLLFRNLRR